MERYSNDTAGLHRFALERLDAARHPKSSHPYKEYECKECGSGTWEVVLDHDPGSDWRDFNGFVVGRCTRCHEYAALFAFFAPDRRCGSEEYLSCPCGSTRFSVAMCERYEGDDGIPGFFDEGVIVGKCADCKRNAVFAFTD